MKIYFILLLSVITIAPVWAQNPTALDEGQLQRSKEYPDDPVCLITTSMGDIYLELFAQEAPQTVQNFLELAQGNKEFTNATSGEKVKKPFYDNLIFHRVIKNFMIQGGCPMGNGMGDPGYKFNDEINAISLGLDQLKVIDKEKGPHHYLLVRSQQDFYQVALFPLVRAMGEKYSVLLDREKAKELSQEKVQALVQEINKRLLELTLKECYENMGYGYNPALKSHHPKKGVIAMANAGPNTNGSQFFINLVDTPWLTGKHTVFGKVIHGMDVVEKIGEVAVGENQKPKQDVTILSIRLFKPGK